MPFDIPDNWTWIRLKDLISIQTGASFKKEQSNKESKDNYIRVLRGGNILPFKYLLKQDDLYIPSELVSENILLKKNDLITPAVTSLENIGKIAVIDKNLDSVTAGGFVYIFRPYINNTTLSIMMSNFISSSLYQSLMKKITKKSGQAFYNMNKEKLLQLYFPLAPLTEQVRIIDKLGFIEPLLEKYDSIEKELSALEAEFPEKLKKSILQFAIEGKLVKQDPNDEPASVLLERIKAEKEKLIKEGKIKRDKNESYIYQGDDKNYYENLLSFYHDFKTPKNWKCTSLINICNFVRRGKTPKYSNEKMIPVIAQKCNQKNGILSLNKALYIDPTTISKYSKDKIIKVNDILINSTGGGTVGRVALVDNELFKKYKTVVADSHITIVRVSDLIVPKYVYFFLKSPLIFDHVEQNCEGSTNQMELNAKTIMSYTFPTPPLNEQRKIAKKVTVLFAQIDS